MSLLILRLTKSIIKVLDRAVAIRSNLGCLIKTYLYYIIIKSSAMLQSLMVPLLTLRCRESIIKVSDRAGLIGAI